jgi:hypothetical protein
MRVGIIEIMETGHIVLAETMCKVFCSCSQNQVFLFIVEKHSDNLSFLSSQYLNLSIIVKPSKQKEEDFLQQIGSVSLDRLYIVTLNRFFYEFSHWNIKTRLFLVIHNLDEWFGISPVQSIQKYINTIFKIHHLRLLIYFFKVHLIYPSFKKRILESIRQTNGCLVVLSDSIRNQLKIQNINLQVEVIPFSVFEPSLVRFRADSTQPLRICVPGILSQYRRNYLALLDIMEKSLGMYKDRFIMDFLGGTQFDNFLNDSKLILEKINHLKQEGFSIIVHNVPFIPPVEYDRELSSTDIILGNMNVVLNKFSEYGRTKETGLPFAMIKAAKPGILPDNYPLPEEICSSTLLYHDYDDLARILAELMNDHQIVAELQKKALTNSKYFSAELIYNKLVKGTS